MKAFLDTSALVKRYVEEPGSEKLETLFLTLIADFFISTLLFPEFSSAMNRKLRNKEIPKADVATAVKEFEKDWNGLFIKIPLTQQLANLAAALTIIHRIKGADAVHLASAKEIEAELFIASDDQLIKAAQKEGFRTFDPVYDPPVNGPSPAEHCNEAMNRED